MARRRWIMMTGMVALVAVLFWQDYTHQADAAAVPGVTDDTIVVGITTPMTGPAALYSKVSEMTEAILLEQGKNIHGRNIKVIRYDDACDPVKGIAATKKLIYDDQVFLMSGGMCSNQALAAKPTIESAQIPYLSQGASAEPIYVPTTKYIFTATWTSRTVAQSMVDFAMTIPGSKKFGIIRHTDEWATSQYKPLIEHLKGKYQKELEVDVTLERGVADVSSQVLRLKQGNLDAVFAILFPAESTAFLRDAHKFGLNVNIIGGPATSVTDQYLSLKSYDPIKKFFDPYVIKYPLDHPKVKVYEELLKKYYPETKFDAWAVFTTQTPLVIIDALKKAGRDLTREKFIEVLETQYNNWAPEEYIGAVPLSFSKTNHVGMAGSVMSVLIDGKFTIIKTYDDYTKLVK